MIQILHLNKFYYIQMCNSGLELFGINLSFGRYSHVVCCYSNYGMFFAAPSVEN